MAQTFLRSLLASFSSEQSLDPFTPSATRTAKTTQVGWVDSRELDLSILKPFHRVSPGVEVGLESILLSLGNLVIYCSHKKSKRLSLVLVSDDLLQLHQLFLIKGDHTDTLCENQWVVFREIFTSMSITGTSISTPTTVARAAPEERPKSIADVAMATSK